MKILTPKQERFCEEIVIGQTLSDAYYTAFQPRRARKKSINERASRLRKSSKIVARIRELQTPVVAQVQRTMADRLNELAYAMFLDPADCFDDFGRPISIRAMPEHVRRAIASYEVDPQKFVTKVRFIDKRVAIMDYSKLMGDIPIAALKPPEQPSSRLHWKSLSLEDRLKLREMIASFLEQRAPTTTIDAPKSVNGGNGATAAPGPSPTR
jgi:hypothetical protein